MGYMLRGAYLEGREGVAWATELPAREQRTGLLEQMQGMSQAVKGLQKLQERLSAIMQKRYTPVFESCVGTSSHACQP